MGVGCIPEAPGFETYEEPELVEPVEVFEEVSSTPFILLIAGNSINHNLDNVTVEAYGDISRWSDGTVSGTGYMYHDELGDCFLLGNEPEEVASCSGSTTYPADFTIRGKMIDDEMAEVSLSFAKWPAEDIFFYKADGSYFHVFETNLVGQLVLDLGLTTAFPVTLQLGETYEFVSDGDTSAVGILSFEQYELI